MTEEEWKACADPTKMLLFIKQCRAMRRPVKERKQRLFAAASCRRLPPLLCDARSQHCIDVVEEFADERATDAQLQAAEMQAKESWLRDAANETALALLQLCAKKVDGLYVSTTTISAAFERQQADANKPSDLFEGRRRGVCPSEERVQCDLLRDIFGNPFHPVTIDPAWNNGTVRHLAQAIYDERAFDRMPILADALEDAGCHNEEILAHCRGDSPHTRGCWAVDLLLEKK